MPAWKRVVHSVDPQFPVRDCRLLSASFQLPGGTLRGYSRIVLTFSD